jgi:colanic acid/amylovoran biosynthesis glycosyltransferase
LWPIAFVDSLFKNPTGTVRYLRYGVVRFGRDLFRRFYLDATIIASRPDVVHFEFGALAVGRTALRDLLGCAVTVSFRGYDLHHVGLSDPAYYADVWRDADQIHLLGEDLWRRAKARGCPSDKPHVLIPPAVDTAALAPAANREAGSIGTTLRPLRLVSVGRVVWKKGYEYALRSVRRLADQGVACEYRIVGDGAEFEAVAFARHQLGLEQSVVLVGACPPEEVRTHLEWADVFVHAAISEGFCNAVIEAQANALPVVTSDAGGLPENVVDGETGFVVPRRRPDLMADRIAQLAAHGDLRRAMGIAGRERALARFDLKQQIGMFELFYVDAAR